MQNHHNRKIVARSWPLKNLALPQPSFKGSLTRGTNHSPHTNVLSVIRGLSNAEDIPVTTNKGKPTHTYNWQTKDPSDPRKEKPDGVLTPQKR